MSDAPYFAAGPDRERLLHAGDSKSWDTSNRRTASRGPSEVDMLALTVTIPSYRQYSDRDGKFTSFNIHVHYRDQTWIIDRRYSQFAQLHEQLRKSGLPGLPQLPPSTFVHNPTNEQFLLRRRLALERYLVDLVSNPGMLQNAHTQSFLGLDKIAVQSAYTDMSWVRRTGGNRSVSSKSGNSCCVML